jgi:phenylacetate-coenzyme A ligase PaaK-like adenylate-forming protein
MQPSCGLMEYNGTMYLWHERAPGPCSPLLDGASLPGWRLDLGKPGMVLNTVRRLYLAAAQRYDLAYVQRCQTALNEALYATPAYAAWRDLDPGPGCDVFARLAALPALTKAGIRAHGPQGFVPCGRDMEAGLAAGEIELVATSGSTSDRVMNVWYQPWWNASEAASWQLNAHARAAATGTHPEAILTSPYCTGYPCEDGYLTMAQRRLDRFLYLTERFDPSTWTDELMARMVEEINAFQPVLLEANPTFLARLARYVVRNRVAVCSPALIVLTYEYASIISRRQIGQAFASPMASSYGCTEASSVFMECEAGRWHQVTASCHVDFLPFKAEHGGPQVGRILVTTFANPWRALLRFDIGDVVRLAAEPCPCGRHEGLTLASLEGRTVNLTLTPEGRAVTQAMVDRALAGVAGLVEYQLFQIGTDAYTLRIVSEDGEPGPVALAARQALRALYGPAVLLAVEPVAAIAPDPPGKYRLARALAPVDAGALLDAQYAPRVS